MTVQHHKHTEVNFIRHSPLLYTLFFFFCCVLFCPAQREYPYINGLKGKVKTVKAVSKRFELKKDSAGRERFGNMGNMGNNGTEYAKFDRKGRFTEWEIYRTKWVNEGEKLVDKHFCKYYADGTIRQDSSYLPEAKVYYNYVYTYNKEKTRLQKWRYTNNTFMESKFLCTETFLNKGRKYKDSDFVNEVTILYNEREDFLQATDFGKSKADQVTVYDSLGRELIYQYWTDNSSVAETETYTYDSSGHVVLYTSSGANPKNNYKEISVYDTNGKPVSTSTYNLKDSLLEKDIYTHHDMYDERRTYDRDGVLVSMSMYKYDKKGNLVENENTDNIIGDYRHISITSYEYDSRNNWTKKSIRDGHGYIYVISRQITYY